MKPADIPKFSHEYFGAMIKNKLPEFLANYGKSVGSAGVSYAPGFSNSFASLNNHKSFVFVY